MLTVYIQQHTKAMPGNQFPLTFLNKNLIYLPLRTFIKGRQALSGDGWGPIIKLSSTPQQWSEHKCRRRGAHFFLLLWDRNLAGLKPNLIVDFSKKKMYKILSIAKTLIMFINVPPKPHTPVIIFPSWVSCAKLACRMHFFTLTLIPGPHNKPPRCP